MPLRVQIQTWIQILIQTQTPIQVQIHALPSPQPNVNPNPGTDPAPNPDLNLAAGSGAWSPVLSALPPAVPGTSSCCMQPSKCHPVPIPTVLHWVPSTRYPVHDSQYCVPGV